VTQETYGVPLESPRVGPPWIGKAKPDLSYGIANMAPDALDVQLKENRLPSHGYRPEDALLHASTPYLTRATFRAEQLLRNVLNPKDDGAAIIAGPDITIPTKTKAMVEY